MNQTIAINPQIAARFKTFTESGRILLFSAPCGFGKTTVAGELLKGRKICAFSADETDFTHFSPGEDWEIMLIDQLHLLQNHEEQQAVSALIHANPQKRFVFLTRGAVPGWLIPFQFSGMMITVHTDLLFFDRDAVARFLKGFKICLSETELSAFLRDSQGYPLAVAILARRMAEGEPYGKKLLAETKHEIYLYYDEMIFRRFELPLRRFLLELAPFEDFSTDLAKMVSGDNRAGELLADMQQNSCMLQFDSLDCFHFWPIFRDFLMWEQNREYTTEQQRALYARGGLYYELREDYAKALEYYDKSGDKNKVSELLIKVTSLHPGMGHYEEMENYFLSLSDEQMKNSPALMQGRSMLCALHADYEGSERWYHELAQFAAVRKKTDAAAREAKSRLTWLDISLPQRGVTGLTETIAAAFKLMLHREIKLPPFSVTSALPSIMNGGKDFSDWSTKDDFLYAVMRTPVETVLGRDGVALPECAIAESKFEKGEDVSTRMLSLVSRLSEVQSKGTPDIEFALVGLLVRTQVDAGRAEDAKRTLLALKERFAEKGLQRFMPNIDAMLCRIALRCGDMEFVEDWYRNKAPKDTVNTRVMKRYQYFTQAMAELTRGDANAAMLTVSPLEPYCSICRRHIDTAHLNIIMAIAKHRKEDASWRTHMDKALSIVEPYGFIRTVSLYGAAVLPLLTEYEAKETAPFRQTLLRAVRAQAVFYPDFLKPQNQPAEPLTETEMQVLRLLCADKSNAEIGAVLNIRLTTVKSHVSHILQKLGVNRRSEAKTAAERLNL